MASSLAKHRYFTFVATSSQLDDAAGSDEQASKKGEDDAHEMTSDSRNC